MISQIRKALFGLGIPLLIVQSASAVPENRELQVTAFHEITVPSKTDRSPTAEGLAVYKNWREVVYIKNISPHSIRVPTDGMTVSIHQRKGQVEVQIFFDATIGPLDMPLREADSRFGVVSLEPGETTILSYRGHCDLPEGQKLVIIYEVEHSLAEPNKLWEGSATVISKYAGEL